MSFISGVVRVCPGSSARGSSEGLAGVAVSNGVDTVLTDARGRYRLPLGKDAGGFVFITVPAGHRAVGNFFFRRVKAGTVENPDFELAVAPELADSEFTFAQITDLHVGSDAMAPPSLARDLADVVGLRPGFVAVTGDLTDEGHPLHYAQYSAAVAGIETPLYPCAGNHDADYEDHCGPSYYSFEAGLCHFIVLNSSLADGAAAQATWLLRELARLPPRKPVIVFAHIPSFRSQLLPGHGYNLSELLGRYNTRAFFDGHVHASKVERVDGTLCVNAPPLCFSDMAVVPRGFILARVRGQEVMLESRFAGINQALTIASPRDGGTVSPGKLKILANAYDSATLMPKITFCLDGGAWQPMTAAGKWAWLGHAEVAGGRHTISVRAQWSSGEITERSAVFTATQRCTAPRVYYGWPQFKGDCGRTGAAGAVAGTELELSWTAAPGGSIFMSSPIVAGGEVYIGLSDDDGGERAGVRAFDAGSGQAGWFHATDASVRHTLAADANRVYALDASGVLTAVVRETGELVWRHRFDPEAVARTWAAAAPLVEAGVVYAGVPLDFGAFEAETGRRLWDFSGSGSGASSCSPVVVRDRIVVGGIRGDGLNILDKATGKLLRNLPDYVFNFATPAYAAAEGILYQSACEWGGGCSLYALDAASGDLLWKFEMMRRWPRYMPVSSPVAAADAVYVGSPDGALWKLDHRGGLVWSIQLGRHNALSPYYSDASPIISTPAIAGSVVYVGTVDGYIYAIDAAKGEVIWERCLGTPILSSPAVAGGGIFIATLDSVYAFS